MWAMTRSRRFRCCVSYATVASSRCKWTACRGARVGEFESDAAEFEWRLLFVAGMWFQDLFNYDFRRTEMCVIPYGAQMGEISFCACKTGVGSRNVIEKIKANASVAESYRTHGRHPVYAKNQKLPLPEPLGTIKQVRLPVLGAG
jgi:hypothetical protein